MTTILVIDDEPQIQKFLRISLNSQHMEVISAESGHAGLNAAASTIPDLIILDLGLPDMDGKYVLQHLVAETRIPVLVLSVRASETEKVACLEMGAYDYIVKPFSVNELLARIKRTLAIIKPLPENEVLNFDNGRLVVDVARHKVMLDQEPVVLTRKEWAVFLHLVQSGGALVSQSTLLQKIWGVTHLNDTHYLRNVIQKLRQKLNDDAAHPRYIETEPGVGYRFIPGS
ncbi:MAG TPA: response regulator transcription factor [Hyphomicrobiales bacterium]|nr:response regulator transcription factor [Hyphomicrobiales bacterium]